MAWLREHLLLVEELDLENGNLRMASGMTKPPQEGETAVATVGKTALMVPLAIQRARLENITLSIQTGGDEFTARGLKMASRVECARKMNGSMPILLLSLDLSPHSRQRVCLA